MLLPKRVKHRRVQRGRMTGKAVLDDGTVIRIKDFLCFAEKVHNKY